VRGKKGSTIDDADVIALDMPEGAVIGDELLVRVSARRPTNGQLTVVSEDDRRIVLDRPIQVTGDDRALEIALPRLEEAV
jgi:hypothetical protein